LPLPSPAAIFVAMSAQSVVELTVFSDVL